MVRRRLGRVAVACATGAMLLSSCGGGGHSASPVPLLTPEAAGAAPHSHRVDGDGTKASAAGFRLAAVSGPGKVGTIGKVSFRLTDTHGQPVRKFVADQTKKLHLYVVRTDLQDFRHLHPVQAADGSWSARTDFDQPGRYRVITEFIPRSHRASLTPVVLGATFTVPGTWHPVKMTGGPIGTDGIVQITAPAHIPTGFDQQVQFVVSDGQDGVVNLGTYLGAYAHLTAFDVATGQFVHAHPLGEPTPGPTGSTLDFHLTLNRPGVYRLFVQVRVDGFLHTIPLTVTAVRPPT